MAIHVQHPDVNDGAETSLEDARLGAIHEFPPTAIGIRRMADLELTVPFDSPDRNVLATIFNSQSHAPMRLRTTGHVGMWNIKRWSRRTKMDRLTLCFAGPA